MLSQDDGWVISDLDLEAGPTRIGGSARLDSQGRLVNAQLSPFRLASGDEARLEANASEMALRIDLRAEIAGCARSLLDKVTSDGPPAARWRHEWRPGGKSRSICAPISLSGHNGEALTNARLGLLIAGDEVRQFELDGRFPGAPVSGPGWELTPQGRCHAVRSEPRMPV